ncbi:MAG: cytidine deaminase [Oscillospiraceae bacterium]|jgi:cytidine deaminase|nr:cytidine deaminase [Oscillospiraceae bacterium]
MEKKLLDAAKQVVGKFSLNGFEGNSAGQVASALITSKGNVYTGICMDVACNLGFCAEHAAIAEMLKNRETEVAWIVAILEDGKILPPCGRCREMLVQINECNVNTKVIINQGQMVPLSELLPFLWHTRL